MNILNDYDHDTSRTQSTVSPQGFFFYYLCSTYFYFSYGCSSASTSTTTTTTTAVMTINTNATRALISAIFLSFSLVLFLFSSTMPSEEYDAQATQLLETYGAISYGTQQAKNGFGSPKFIFLFKILMTWCYAGLLHGVVIAEQLVLYLCMISQSESTLSQESGFLMKTLFFSGGSLSAICRDGLPMQERLLIPN